MSISRSIAREDTRPVTRSILSAGGGGFSPRSLFGPGEQGGWYDPSDISTLFQDTAGTVPVTAPGQPVGRVNDKSPNANHLLQATAASRPIYQASGARGWLEFDGVDDYMLVTYPSAPTIATAVLGCIQVAPAANADIWDNRTTGGWVLRLAVGGTTDVFGVAASTPIVPIASVANNPLSADFVLSAGLSATQVFVAVNNGVANVQSAASAAGDARFALGVLNTTLANNLFAGRLYQLTHIHRALSAPELLSAQNFTKAKSGVP